MLVENKSDWFHFNYSIQFVQSQFPKPIGFEAAEVQLYGCLETRASAILNTHQVYCVNFHHSFFPYQYNSQAVHVCHDNESLFL